MNERCGSCGGTGRVYAHNQLPDWRAGNKSLSGMVNCTGCNGRGTTSWGEQSTKSTAAQHGKAKGRESALGFLTLLMSKALYLVTPLALWALFMAAWEGVSGEAGSQPDWYVVLTLASPIVITVVLRKHLRWLAPLSVLAAFALMVVVGD